MNWAMFLKAFLKVVQPVVSTELRCIEITLEFVFQNSSPSTLSAEGSQRWI